MKSRLYDYCCMRWNAGAWKEVQLITAVEKKYITGDEKKEIMDEK
ncbi:hypothetical protein ABOUO_33 [Brevibacillus phage Abouo]|uniref:XkdX family protein n=2 Tax=Abouovirus TaxID=1984773 RepID=S5MP49_9CAUD|nr:XkdX family protein [Brevibacillus phage Davies]YP_009220090.1 XkdX family protein [Brevibacillus phage Abouo]AGR47473.1 hypothetical protein ABOUO_33 [Brevibacillus phage Abouo]AGR47565.1 hypothetical protein DAVIES_33 [Brevibacillus phage Davies]